MAPVASLRPTSAVPPLRGHLALGLAGCELAASAVDVLAVGLPLWLGLGARLSLPVRAAGVLAGTLWLASVLRLFDVARPLLVVHARKRQGEAVPANLAEPAQHALMHLPSEASLIRFCAWCVVVCVACGWTYVRGLPGAQALQVAGLCLIQAAGAAAFRARLFEGWLRAIRSWLLPNIDGMRLYMQVYRRRLWRAAVLVLTAGHGVWLWMTSATVGIGGAALGMWGWPVLFVGGAFWARSLRRRTNAVEAYFNVAYRAPSSSRGPARDEPAAVTAFRAAQAVPYRLSGYLTLILALTFLSAVAVGRWWLNFEARVAARLLLVACVAVLATSGFALMLLRRTMTPFLRHLGSRHHLPLAAIRSPAGLRLRLAVVFLSFGACVAGPWMMAMYAGAATATLPGAVGMLLAVGLALLVTRDTVEPLTELEARSEEMARGELARPVSPAGEADEIGRLTMAFEEMRRALRDRLRSTESINIDLEREVRRRTDALEKRNAELAEALEKLQRAKDDLVRSEKLASMGRLVAGIAHEINNPVNAVINTLDPLSEQLDEIEREGVGGSLALVRDAKEMLGVIRRGAGRTKAIVRALHNYSRGDEHQFRSVDLHRVVADTVDLLRHQLRDVSMKVSLPMPCEAWAIPGQIDQVIMNLVVNAAQALGDRDGEIVITATQVVDQWRITISDNGPGIPAEVLPKIFDPFFTTKTVGEGAGLGLSIVHGIVERHGGEVTVDTGPAGTTFALKLPVALPAGQAAQST